MKNLIGLILTITTTFSFAQQDLTFREAVEIALEENVTLKNQHNQLQTVQAQRLNNRAQYLPNVSINGGGNRTDGQQINQQTGAGQNITTDAFSASLDASLSIFNGMNRIANWKSSGYDFKSQQNSIERTRQQVMVNVANQFLQVLLDQELLRIAEQNLDTQKKLLEQIRNFKEVGTRPITDVYNQEAQVRNLEVQVLRAKNTLRNDRALLAQILQIEPGVELNLAYPEWDVNQINMDGLELNALFDQALANRQDMKQLENQQQSLKYQVRSATSTYFPSLNVFASYRSFYQNIVGAENIPSFSDQFTDLNPQLRYGFRFSIPIFDRFTTRSNRINAKMQQDNVRNNAENLSKTVKIDVQRAYQNFQDAITNYQASQIQLKAADLALETQQESYRLGVSNQVDLSQSNQLYVQAEASKAQAELTLLFQKIILDFNVGTLKFEDIP